MDLNGPSTASTDYSISTNFNSFQPQLIPVASSNVTVVDVDEGAVLVSVRVDLSVGSALVGGRLVMGGGLCPDNHETVCHLRYL